MFFEYVLIFKFFILCFFLVLFLFLLSFFFFFQQSDFEKTSVYECGFNPFGDARLKFEVRFFLVGILFLVFDVEIAFLFPWVLVALDLSSIGVISLFFFLFILFLGFFYEWLTGALEWN
jgi:NADH-quinone oxidoreductase subunit A